MFAPQKRIGGRKFTALGDVFDKAEVHGQVAVAALPGVQRTIHIVQDMRMEQIECDQHHGKQTGPHGTAIFVFGNREKSRMAV